MVSLGWSVNEKDLNSGFGRLEEDKRLVFVDMLSMDRTGFLVVRFGGSKKGANVCGRICSEKCKTSYNSRSEGKKTEAIKHTFFLSNRCFLLQSLTGEPRPGKECGYLCFFAEKGEVKAQTDGKIVGIEDFSKKCLDLDLSMITVLLLLLFL